MAPDSPFPLPLTSIERLFLLDDVPAYPMHYFCRLRFDGCLQQHSLKEALAFTLQRHPLLNAIVRKKDSGVEHWLPFLDALAEVHWLEQEPDAAFPRAPSLDLRARPGLHLFAVVGTRRSDLVVQFHHAVCDGIGALNFITDLLTAYVNFQSGTQKYPFSPLDVTKLRRRAPLPLTGWKLLRWAIRHIPGIPALWALFRRQPVALVPHRPNLDEAAPSPDYPEAWIHHFTREESAALAGLAQGCETSVNSLLARDLLVAIARWRQQNGHADDAWLRLMLPINMRTPADRRLPATNVLSAVYLDCHLRHGVQPGDLLHRIHGLMEEIKHDDLGVAWLLILRLLEKMPRPWAKVRASRRKCLISTVLTNLGPVLAGSPLPRVDRRLQVGPLVLEEVEFLCAARPLQCVGFAVTTYAGRMSLGMRYHAQALTREQAKTVLDIYVQTIRTSIADARRSL